MDEIEEYVQEAYTISELVKETGLSRTGILNFIKRRGIKPVGVDGKKNVYDLHVLESLLDRKQYKTPPKSETFITPKISLEYEERISHLESKVNEYDRIFKIIVKKLKRLEASKK